MLIEALAFYALAGILTLSALLVITVKNPVHSVLFLILGFFNAAGLFVLLGAEFIAMILVIVYVGAVAVLFLFVVMMLDISFADLRKGAMQYVSIGLVIGAVLLAELVMVYKAWTFAPERGQYYYHYFMKQQPDLNWHNPEVKKAMWDAARFWLDLGVDGFRLDIISAIYEDPRASQQSA